MYRLCRSLGLKEEKTKYRSPLTVITVPSIAHTSGSLVGSSWPAKEYGPIGFVVVPIVSCVVSKDKKRMKKYILMSLASDVLWESKRN
jgi:hypothetical protein